MPPLSQLSRRPRLIDAICPGSPTGAHHWIVDMPSPEGMKGRCKWCGTERDYSVPGSSVSIPKHMLQYFRGGVGVQDTFYLEGKLNLRRTW